MPARPTRRDRTYSKLPEQGMAEQQARSGHATLMNDSDRPPVLAHQRFAADRKSFAGLSLAQRFQRIHDTNLWGAAESISGLGSELDATAGLRAELPRLFGKLAIPSLLDAPCGEANWINHADLGVRYVGVDIVPALIERL